MTEEDKFILRENNKMLKQILNCLQPKDEVTPNEFLANVLANLLSNRIDK